VQRITKLNKLFSYAYLGMFYTPYVGFVQIYRAIHFRAPPPPCVSRYVGAELSLVQRHGQHKAHEHADPAIVLCRFSVQYIEWSSHVSLSVCSSSWSVHKTAIRVGWFIIIGRVISPSQGRYLA
jgi:hypothetical protein